MVIKIFHNTPLPTATTTVVILYQAALHATSIQSIALKITCNKSELIKIRALKEFNGQREMSVRKEAIPERKKESWNHLFNNIVCLVIMAEKDCPYSVCLVDEQEVQNVCFCNDKLVQLLEIKMIALYTNKYYSTFRVHLKFCLVFEQVLFCD